MRLLLGVVTLLVLFALVVVLVGVTALVAIDYVVWKEWPHPTTWAQAKASALQWLGVLLVTTGVGVVCGRLLLMD